MIYGSVCSGIEAATIAWEPLGWKPAFFSEIEKFPRAVLAHHYPEVPLHGDFTTIKGDEYGSIDLLVGGTPCQAFSVAGLRGGLSDSRGNLALEFLRLVDRTRPRWVVWENVPGVLSSVSHAAPDPCPPPPPLDLECDGAEVDTEDEYDGEELHAFQCFLAGLSELGYGFAYRVLDSQFFGVAQRRRRVFVVGYLGDWRRAAAVLFEREGLSGDPPPRREPGQRIARPIAAGSPSSGGVRNDADTADNLTVCGPPTATGGTERKHGHGWGQQEFESGYAIPVAAFGGNNTSGPEVSTSLSAHAGPHGRLDFDSETFIAHSLRGEGFDASEDGTGRGTPLVPIHFQTRGSNIDMGQDVAATLGSNADRASGGAPCIAFSSKDHGADAEMDLSPTLRAGGHDTSHANAGVPPAVAFSIMPMQSGTNYKARLTDISQPLMAGGPVGGNQGGDFIIQPAVAFALRGREGGAVPEVHEDGGVSALRGASGGSSRDYVVFDTTQITSSANRSKPQAGDPCHPLAAGAHPPAIAELTVPLLEIGKRTGSGGVGRNGTGIGEGGDPMYSLQAGAQHGVGNGSAVRRLTPRECERLQAFPDDFTRIPYNGGWAADGPRYKALGNSMTTTVVRWIGERIQAVDAIADDQVEALR